MARYKTLKYEDGSGHEQVHEQDAGQHIQVQARRTTRTRAGDKVIYKAGWGGTKQNRDIAEGLYRKMRARVSQRGMYKAASTGPKAGPRAS